MREFNIAIIMIIAIQYPNNKRAIVSIVSIMSIVSIVSMQL